MLGITASSFEKQLVQLTTEPVFSPSFIPLISQHTLSNFFMSSSVLGSGGTDINKILIPTTLPELRIKLCTSLLCQFFSDFFIAYHLTPCLNLLCVQVLFSPQLGNKRDCSRHFASSTEEPKFLVTIKSLYNPISFHGIRMVFYKNKVFFILLCSVYIFF